MFRIICRVIALGVVSLILVSSCGTREPKEKKEDLPVVDSDMTVYRSPPGKNYKPLAFIGESTSENFWFRWTNDERVFLYDIKNKEKPFAIIHRDYLRELSTGLNNALVQLSMNPP